MQDDDAIELPEADFRRTRRYLAPWVFAWPGDEDRSKTWPPPSDLISREAWDSILDLPTDVALKSSSYRGALIARLQKLQEQWSFSWPESGEAPFMEEPALLAGEEFDALVFNAVHGWYRQALGCLRNALETMLTAAALAVNNNDRDFQEWRAGRKEIWFHQAREMLRDGPTGKRVDADAAPQSVLGDGSRAWAKSRYKRLCAYAHGQVGYNNADFWESNGPIYRPSTLALVETEFRETLALCYLLLRLGWQSYTPGPGPAALLGGLQDGWQQYERLLRKWLL